MFLPIFSFTFMLALAQYESSLYFVTFCAAASYLLHKHTEPEKKNDNVDTI